MERINTLLQQRTKPRDSRSREEIVKAAFKTINPVIKAIFDDLPQVNVIVVQGYTPYFNDGEPCEWRFSASVDWAFRDDIYYCRPIYFSGYGEDKSEYTSLISEKNLEDRDNLVKARDLILTLSDEFNVADSENGTWWIFVRDEEAENGFAVKSDTFDHD